MEKWQIHSFNKTCQKLICQDITSHPVRTIHSETLNLLSLQINFFPTKISHCMSIQIVAKQKGPRIRYLQFENNNIWPLKYLILICDMICNYLESIYLFASSSRWQKINKMELKYYIPLSLRKDAMLASYWPRHGVMWATHHQLWRHIWRVTRKYFPNWMSATAGRADSSCSDHCILSTWAEDTMGAPD